jgi:hypothetical protein
MARAVEIVVFAGDNCGPEVTNEAIKVRSFPKLLGSNNLLMKTDFEGRGGGHPVSRTQTQLSAFRWS